MRQSIALLAAAVALAVVSAGCRPCAEKVKTPLNIGLLAESPPQAARWASFLGKEAVTRSVSGGENLAMEQKSLDVLIVADAPVSRVEVEAIEAFIANGGKIIGAGKAGFQDGNFNLSRVFKAGRHAMSMGILYPLFVTPEEMVEIAKWAAMSGADGISVIANSTMRGYHNGPLKKTLSLEELQQGVESEYTKLFRPILMSEFEQLMKKDALIPLGMPEVPKALWVQVWERLWSSKRERTSPETLVAYAKKAGFNMLITEEARDGFFLHHSNYNVPPDHASDPKNEDYLPALVKACEREGLYLWANLLLNGQSGTYWQKHPDQRVTTFDGRKDRRVCPLAGKAFYEWQLKVVDELLRKFPYISGLMFDESEVCGCCDVCRAEFKKQYGREARGDDDEDLIKFRADQNTRLVVAPLIATAKKARSGIVIAVANPAGTFGKQGVDLSAWADAGMNVWANEMARRYSISRGGRRWLNVEESMICNTPQYFQADNGEKTLKVDAFRGAQVKHYVKTPDGVLYPAVVTANDGNSLYFAGDPLSSETNAKEIRDFLRRAAERQGMASL